MNFASMKNYKRIAASVGLATLMTVAVAAPALAADDQTSMDVEITAGTFTVEMTGLTFDESEVAYSLVNKTITTAGVVPGEGETGASTVTVNNMLGNGNGWSATVSSTGLTSANDAIAPGQISVVLSGFDSDDDASIGAGGTLDADRTIMTAADGLGSGDSVIDLDVTIDIPAKTLAGVYSGNLVVTAVEDVD